MSVDMENTSGYRYDPVHGRLGANKDPILEEGRCGTVNFPVRIFYDTRQKGDDILPHLHKALEILCVISGEIHLIVGHVEKHLSSGQIALINSYDVHTIIGTDGSDAKYYVLQVEPDILSSYGMDVRRYMPMHDEEKFLMQEDDTMIALNTLIQQTFEHGQQRGKATEVNILADVFGIFAKIIARSGNEDIGEKQVNYEKKASDRLQYIFSYVGEHYSEDISLDEIARNVHLTRNYFCRFFKQETGITFVEFLNKYRCKEAGELMRNTDMTITEIASSVGFKNLSYFNKTYKKLTGDTPSKNRRQVF